MRPHCRTTSTSTSWIGLPIMSSRSDWGIASTCGMRVAARCITNVIFARFLFSDLKIVLIKFITAQVTKLCDLGAEDTVCSVGWAQRGTHLAVGTNQGKVQVVLAPIWNDCITCSGSIKFRIKSQPLLLLKATQSPNNTFGHWVVRISEICNASTAYQ
jgi:hypothetical protein